MGNAENLGQNVETHHPQSTPTVKLRMKCRRLRNLRANSPPAKVEKNVASDSTIALIYSPRVVTV
jgi:hypothetical protein